MKAQDLDVGFANRQRYAAWAVNRVPAVAGVYALTNVYDQIAYVGESQDLRRRMLDHLNNPRMTRSTDSTLVHSFCFIVCDENEIKRKEQALLTAYKFHTGLLPPLNRAGP